MKEIFKKNKECSADKRVEVLEKIVGRLSRRVHKTTTAIVSPQTISTCVSGEDVKGDIIKCMLFKGNLRKLNIIFKEKPKSLVYIEVNSLNEDSGDSKTFRIDRIKGTFDLDINTIDGSLLTISIHPVDPKYKITEVWLAVLWTPHISNVKIKQYLIDNLIGEIDEGI